MPFNVRFATLLSILSQLLPPVRGQVEKWRRTKLSILSQLLQRLPSQSPSPFSRLTFNSFPVASKQKKRVRNSRQKPVLSILSQLLPLPLPLHLPSYFKPFNSFPVASGRWSLSRGMRGIHTFQFFPSCFSAATPLTGRPRPRSSSFQFFPSCFYARAAGLPVSSLTFNSFPVASEGFVPGLAYKAFLFP